MFLCATCDARMQRTRTGPGAVWQCNRCGGCHASLQLVRQAAGAEAVSRLWTQVQQQTGTLRRTCPTCPRSMLEVLVPGPEGSLVLDVCGGCGYVWFDPGEFAALARSGPAQEPEPEPAIEAASEAYARARAELDRTLVERRMTPSPDEVDATWKRFAAFVVPVEISHPVYTRPIATWSLAAAIAVISILAFANMDGATRSFGLVPAEAGRYGGLTFFTSFFLHAGWGHLLGNLYFFLVFGDNVEEFLGRKRFLLLVAGATLVGGIIHVAGDPSSTIPCVGASGGISGIIAFYGFRFPRARLAYRPVWFFPTFGFPAWAGLGFWAVFQAIGVYAQLMNASNVSAMAHVGGAAVGIALWVRWRRR